MKLLTGQRRPRPGQGFTLVEVLLATVLLMLLLGAMVFSLAPVQRGAALEEGALQFEGLLRYAQAQAAHSGRQVQLRFEEETADEATMAFGNVRLLWEPDPFGAPGEFVELPQGADAVRRLLELVLVESVRPFDPGMPENSAGGGSTNEAPADAWMDSEFADYQPPLFFYPDGSSDTAEIILAARDEEDPRRMRVRLVGITGTIRRSLVAEEPEPTETPDEADSPKPGTVASPAASSLTTPASEPTDTTSESP